jgi:hypothetical protein
LFVPVVTTTTPSKPATTTKAKPKPKKVPIRGGLSALVDAEDFERVMARKWYRLKGNTTDYAMSRDSVLLHRLVMNAAPGTVVHHKDGVGFNCTKRNLRELSRAAHVRTTGPVAGSSSKYKGVSKAGSARRPWRACYRIGGKSYHLGSYVSEEAAARAYNEAQRRFVGVTSGAYFNDTPGSRFGRIAIGGAALRRLNEAVMRYRSGVTLATPRRLSVAGGAGCVVQGVLAA